MSPTPRMDRLIAEPSPLAMLGKNVVPLVVPGVEMDNPQVAPNLAGLDLLREIAGTQKALAIEVGNLGRSMARFDGQALDERLKALDGELGSLRDKLEAQAARILELQVERRPFKLVGGELIKGAVAIGYAALLAWLALKH